MTIKTFSVALVLSFVWTACNNDAPKQSATPTEESPATAPEGTMQTALPQEATPSTTMPDPTVLPSTPPPAPAPAGGSAKTNPPHGQPGHVCGVPVGSPLDGSAGAANPTQNKQPAAKSVTTPPSGAAGAATVAPGTNPPHGQPGHVCAVPVGAPLPKE